MVECTKKENGPGAILLTKKAAGSRAEHNLRQALEEKDLVIREMRHRFSNNLQILAGILLAKARLCRSDETRSELNDAHRRVLSTAAIQQHLDVLPPRSSIDVARYLFDLCGALTQSMAHEDMPVTLAVEAESRAVPSRDAVSIGLIVTELVINALKHAFPEQTLGASIVVSYRMAGPNWTLSVCDNGVGKNPIQPFIANYGLGTRLVDLLAKQLDGEVATATGPSGTTVSVTHASSLRAALYA
jgi:chemotaxis protein methyltransferase CheR